MADRFREIMDLIRQICEEENLRATLKHSFRNGLMAGVGGAVGSVLGGPWGTVPGAVLGASLAAATGEDFKPLFQVIAEWPDETKRQLTNNVEAIIRRVDAKDVATFAAMAAGAGSAMKGELVEVVVDYCQNVMSLDIARG